MAVPEFFAFLLLLILPESPRYLHCTGKQEATKKVLENMYRWNHKKNALPYPVNILFYYAFIPLLNSY